MLALYVDYWRPISCTSVRPVLLVSTRLFLLPVRLIAE